MVIIHYILMCLIFGTTFLAIKIGVDAGVPPFLSAGLRFFIAGLLLFSFMIWRKKTTIRLFFRKEMFLTGVGLTFGTFATLYLAEQYVTSGIAAVLSATGPMMIIIIQIIVLKQKANRTSFIGCVIGVIGVMLLILPSFSIEISSYWLIGCFAIIIGEIFYASGSIYTKHVIKKFETTSPIALNAAQMMHGGILLILLSFCTENIQLATVFSAASIGSLFYLIVVGSMVGHSLYYWLVSQTNPVFPSTWLYISPLIAVGLGVVFYHEYFSWLTGIGALTIITGTILVNFETLRGLFLKKRVILADVEN
ncbi:DMT family transporter [Metabacillus bambusae]|uniref:EamA family transporter n=1 Tax=Metabacillus bambusae TaxID=2795218 RepID=A0ABS3N9A2_9BACI|nr:EamA family transporter [Metabacillus bambusae]MBO1514877.1 EamA family transporter [Metabacillus bambusae]